MKKANKCKQYFGKIAQNRTKPQKHVKQST